MEYFSHIDPDLWHRAASYFQAQATIEQERTLGVTAAHLPGMAGAIFALADHATNDNVDSGCCGLPPRDWYEQPVRKAPF